MMIVVTFSLPYDVVVVVARRDGGGGGGGGRQLAQTARFVLTENSRFEKTVEFGNIRHGFRFTCGRFKKLSIVAVTLHHHAISVR